MQTPTPVQTVTPEVYAALIASCVKDMMQRPEPERTLMLSRLWSTANRLYVTDGKKR